MRISTLALVSVVVAVLLALAREEVGRVAVIVFMTGLGATVAGVTAVMAMFRTVGAIGESKDLLAGMEALLATVVVVGVGSASVVGVMFGGGLLIRWAIP